MKTLKMDEFSKRDPEFSRHISGDGVTNLHRCFQCSACSDGCPVASAMDYYPHQIIQMVRLGLKEKVLKSTSIWICLSCQTCSTRCPNEIDIVALMGRLRPEAARNGLNRSVDNIRAFHTIFANQIKKRGRIDESGLLFNYKLKTFDIFPLKRLRDELNLAQKMFEKGRLKRPSRKRYSPKEMKDLYRKLLE